MKPYIAFAALAALAPHAASQQQAAKPHPADPAASVPANKYESAFTGYRGFREEPLAPWRSVNDEVARAGGHIGIVGGAGRSAPSSGSPATKPPPPPIQPTPGPIQK
jgi:hypothetical protein